MQEYVTVSDKAFAKRSQLINLQNPHITHWTLYEGGYWLKAPLHKHAKPAAVKFVDGSVYDFILEALHFPAWR